MPQLRLEVRHLRAFVTLVETGRVTAAARVLGVAQSTVSEALASLERSLGVEVIVRGHGGTETKLTAAGQALLPHARSILAAVDNAQLAVAGSAKQAQGVVQIVANESVSTYLLPAALAELRTRWTATQFSVTVATCPGVREAISSDHCDVGFMLESPGRKGVDDPESADRRVVATQVALVVFAKPAHPLLRAKAPVRRADLTHYPLFVSDAAGDFHVLVQRLFKSIETQPKIEATGSVEGVKRAVIAGSNALGLLPAYAVAEELRLGTLHLIDIDPAVPRVRLTALLSPTRARHPVIDELLDALGRVTRSA